MLNDFPTLYQVPLLGSGYYRKVLRTRGDALIAYWPMWEAGGSIVQDRSPEYNNGTYTGVTLGQAGIGDGRTCPLFDGSSDYADIYSAGLNGDFNGQLVTIAAWAKLYNAAAWTDGVRREVIYLGVDASNYIEVCKNSTSNNVAFVYYAGGTAKQIGHTTSDTNWFHLVLTVTRAGDAMKAYVNGSQTGSTQTGLGTWAGSLSSSNTLIGAQNKSPGAVWNGWIAHIALWAATLSDVEIAYLAKK